MTKLLAEDVRRLRSHCPPDLPVRLRTERGLAKRAGCLAYCEQKRGHYLVVFDAKVKDYDLARALLIHEWAHALAKPWRSRIHHSRAWGVAFARCYRVAVDGWVPR